MSGTGPVRAAERGLPSPRPESVAPASVGATTPTPGSAEVGSASSSVDVPTEEHAALLDPDGTGGLDSAAIAELLSASEPVAEVPGAGTSSAPADRFDPGDALSLAGAELVPTPSPGDDTPTWPGVEIARGSAVWFWLWGPLLAAVLVVSFLAGMASAPVTLPAPTPVRPASLLDVRGRLLTVVDPPAGTDQVPAQQLPDLLLRSIVAVQDPGYFARSGLSATDLVKAGAADLVRVRRHGSTIEERYAHQVRVAGESKLPSLRESTVAARLAQKMSRRTLLIRYVDGMYFGNGVYGVSAAARFYFGTSVTQLDPAQIAMLAGIADDPSRRNPVATPALAIAAQQRAIRAMQRSALLTGKQADAALREPIDARAHRQLERPSPAPDFTALVESSLLSRYGDDLVYGQDLRVSTPLDLDLQAALGDTVRRLVPGNVPAVLALASDPRTGDIRAMVNRSASSSANGPEGASDVLFTRRPLGSLATALPIPVGDGRSASLGEVAATVGAVETDGVRHDLRPLTSVTRPADGGQPAQTLDQENPLPPGQQVLDADRAQVVTAGLRASARVPGAPAAGLPFMLTAVSGSEAPASTAPTSTSSTSTASTSTAPTWYVGCVPDLCLTVWTGNASAGPAGAPVASKTLAASIVTTTLEQYIAAAPGRLTLPPLPRPRDTERRAAPPAAQPVPSAPRPAARVSVRPTPTVTRQPSSVPQPSATPSPEVPKGPSPSPSASGGGDKGGASDGGNGAPVAEGVPRAGTAARAGT